jgi:hypothetical protein
MNKKEMIPFGKLVRISSAVEIQKGRCYPRTTWYTYRSVKSYNLQEPLVGVLIGGRYIQEGETSWDSDEGATFTHRKTMFVYLVQIGYMNKPLMVLPEQVYLEPLDDPIDQNFKLPYFYKYISKEDRKYLSQGAKDQERDKRGRFV